jgi:alpha-tubulin suppressor-like RCC1 family protein
MNRTPSLGRRGRPPALGRRGSAPVLALGLAAVIALATAGCDDDLLAPAFEPVSYTAIAAGGAHTCGLALGGALYCWGRGASGQLGDGRAARSAIPVRTQAPPATFAGVAPGAHHSCAIATGGGAYCWGDNGAAQLGTGSGGDAATPTPVAGGIAFASLSAGRHHTCGVTAAGEAWCWGSNAHGQLGSAGVASASTPVLVAGDTGFVHVAAGGHHTCALTAEGEAWCWGRNDLGQLGVGDTGPRAEPTPVQTEDRFVRIAAGERHTCAITDEGLARCWGSSEHGELGNLDVAPRDDPELPTTVPTPVYQLLHDGVIAFRTISAGAHFTCGTDDLGRAWCWGLGYAGQLGGNRLGVRAFPHEVFATLDMHFTDISAGPGTHACAATSSLAAFCWGTSHDGAIGPVTTFSKQPVRMQGPARGG